MPQRGWGEEKRKGAGDDHRLLCACYFLDITVLSAEFGTVVLQIYYFISLFYFEMPISTGRSSKGNEREAEERIGEA